MKNTFPVNYFATIFSPIKIFINRHYLSLWQIGLIILLLNGLMLLPLSSALGNVQSADLNNFVPKAIATLSEETIDSFNHTIIDSEKSDRANFVASIDDVQLPLASEFEIVFAKDGFIIQEGNKPTIKQSFLPTIPLKKVASKEELVTLLSNHWFQANRLAIVLTNFINIWILMFFNFIGILLGASFLIWLTKFGKIFSIHTFSEAFQIVLNAFGLPTLIAMMIGFLVKDPNSLILTQSTLFILNLLWVYWKTHFNDNYLKRD